MILPDKNIKPKYSLLNCGGQVLKMLSEPLTMTALWEKTKEYNSYLGYDKFVLTMDFLFMINAISIKNGVIQRCDLL